MQRIYLTGESPLSRPKVARTSQLYNYLLRFYLTMPPPLKRIVPDPLYTQALIKPYKNLSKEKKKLEGKECPNFIYRETGSIYTRHKDIKELQPSVEVV